MKSILIAEDEYDIAFALEMILSDEGYQVKLTSNGRDALAALSSERPDLVILDIMMPYVTGVEALRVIRSNPDTSTLPVILMSAATPQIETGDRKRTVFLRKPFNLDQILQAVETLIGK